ncbi:MAG: hypothetical protein ABI540_03865 [Spartobacteria bacterium]
METSPNNPGNTDATAGVPPAGRKHPVHQPVCERRGVPIIVFLTVCTKDRKKILADRVIHQHLVDG